MDSFTIRTVTTEGLLRVSELSERAGVAIATIKFYIREGLLPAPRVIAGRNVGYYDAGLVERLTLIKKLREERFLPLRVIRAMLVDHDAGTGLSDAESSLIGDIRGTVLGTIKQPGPLPGAFFTADARPVARAEVLSRFAGSSAEDLNLLEDMGLLAPEGTGDERRYGADDLRLIEAMRRAEAAGLSRELFPVESMGHYAEVLGELVAREMKLFARGADGKLSRQRLQELAEHVLEVTEPVVVLVRRNLIRKALREVQAPAQRSQTAPKPSKKERRHVG